MKLVDKVLLSLLIAVSLYELYIIVVEVDTLRFLREADKGFKESEEKESKED
jgi:hypothetical protein